MIRTLLAVATRNFRLRVAMQPTRSLLDKLLRQLSQYGNFNGLLLDKRVYGGLKNRILDKRVYGGLENSDQHFYLLLDLRLQSVQNLGLLLHIEGVNSSDVPIILLRCSPY